MRWWWALAGVLALSWPATAGADDWRDLELGIGVLGQVGGNFIDRPEDVAVTPGNPVELVYPGFGGLGGGGGLSLDLRYKKFIGVQMDLMLSSDRGVGYIDLLRVSIGQTSIHVPIMAKLLYPGDTVRPSIALGVDFIAPQSLEITTDPLLPSTATLFGSQASAHAMIVGAIGVEFLLPYEGADLRIPVSIRGGINPSTPDAARDRAAYVLDGTLVRSVIFDSAWQYHLSFNIGVSYFLF